MTTEADVINASCQIPPWSGMSSFLPPMTSFSALKTQLDSYAQFTRDDMLSLPGNLAIVAAGTTFNNGVLLVQFTLNGKTGMAYAWARPKGMVAPGPCILPFGRNGKAVLITPGSGNNQADSMITLNAGYQAVVFNPVCTVADAFVQIVPGQDWGCLQGSNGLGYLPSAIDAYAIENGSSLAVLTIIQLAAIQKWLTTVYAKTAICGLSRGAFMAAMAALLMQPTAAVIASGFSLKEYDWDGIGSMGGNEIPSIQSALPKADLIARIKAAATQWLFSCSTTETLMAMRWEAEQGYTADLLANPNVTSTVHANGHVYPPNMASFLAAAFA